MTKDQEQRSNRLSPFVVLVAVALSLYINNDAIFQHISAIANLIFVLERLSVLF